MLQKSHSLIRAIIEDRDDSESKYDLNLWIVLGGSKSRKEIVQ